MGMEGMRGRWCACWARAFEALSLIEASCSMVTYSGMPVPQDWVTLTASMTYQVHVRAGDEQVRTGNDGRHPRCEEAR